MSTRIGDRLPAPVRLEFGLQPGSGDPAKAVIVGSIDEDGSIRFAVVSNAEILPIDDKRLSIALAADSTTCSNVTMRKAMSLWYVHRRGRLYDKEPHDEAGKRRAGRALHVRGRDRIGMARLKAGCADDVRPHVPGPGLDGGERLLQRRVDLERARHGRQLEDPRDVPGRDDEVDRTTVVADRPQRRDQAGQPG